MRNRPNFLDSRGWHSYTSVQRVAGGGASAQPVECKENPMKKKAKKEDMKKGGKKK